MSTILRQRIPMWLCLMLLLTSIARADDDHGHDDHGHSDHTHDTHEDSVQIPADMARQMRVATAVVGPGTLTLTRSLTGRVHVDPGRVSRVRARYAGLIETVNAEPWSEVKRDQLLARVQSSDSLQSYAVRAPIGGHVVTRDAQVGEVTGNEPLFVIADLSRLWIEFDVFDHDLDAIRVGQRVSIAGLHGEPLASGEIDMLSPLAIHAAQSVRARVIVDNQDRGLRPGQYVRGEVVIEQKDVALRVPKSALQRMQGGPVVFEKTGDEYEMRALKLGARDADSVEVLGGLHGGAEIVIGNSYLIKADLEKSGAGHQH